MSRRGAKVRARVRGVYGTAHTTAGDVDTGPPERLTIDGAMTTYELPFDAPADLTISSATLHLGTVTVEVRVAPPVTVGRGDRVTLVMPVAMGAMVAMGGPPRV